jgi:hypothetical protein
VLLGGAARALLACAHRCLPRCAPVPLVAAGYKLVGIKVVHASRAHLEGHYADLKDKPFFPGVSGQRGVARWG